MLKSNLKLIMAMKGINTVKELAEMCKITRKPLDKLYHNEDLGSIKLETLAKICDILNCPLYMLITNESGELADKKLYSMILGDYLNLTITENENDKNF